VKDKKIKSKIPQSTWVADISITALKEFPLVSSGCDIVQSTLACVKKQNVLVESGDILVFTQKIVSKAEGREVNLKDIAPSEKAKKLSIETGKDARLVELILSESKEIVRKSTDLIIAEHRLGIILANAGIDHSNIRPDENGEWVLLLPIDPDATSKNYRQRIYDLTNKKVGIIISDSVGRAWRNGTIGLAIGVAGLPAVEDHRGKLDLFGVPLVSSQEAIADELASAASLVQGQADEGCPVALIRGFKILSQESPAQTLVRRKEFDLFR
tara:strand:+ start:217 stop:1026 length:810 start_codon:yes stop_codon:yes gene_type:complete